MALDASSLRKIVYKTVEDSTTISAAQAKLVEFSGDFAADIFVKAGDYNFSVEISSEGKYAFSMIDFGAGTSKFYVATDGTSVYLKRTNSSDVAENIGSVTVRKGIRFGEIEDAAIASDSTGSLTWRQIDKTYSTQLESLTVDGNFNLRSDLDVNGGDITTTQTTFNLIDTGATTINFAGAATTANIAYDGSSSASTVNIATGAATGTNSKTINLGTGNASAATNVNIGYTGSGTTAINSPATTVAGTLGVTGSSSLTGNVGVGQSSGTEKLEITGNAKVTSSATTGSSVSVIGNSITSGNLLSLSSTSAAKSSLYGLLSINSSGAKSGSTARAMKIDVSDAGSGANVAFSAVVSGATGSNEGLVATTTSSGNAISEAARLLAYSENGPAVGANIYEVTASNNGDAYGIYQELISTSYGTAYGANLNVYSSDYKAYGLQVAAVSAAEEDAFSIYAGFGENYLAGNTGIGQLPGTERLEVTGNIKVTGDLAVNGGDITTSSQNLSIGHSGYSGSNPGISIGAIGTTVSIPGNLVVSGTTTYTGSASYNSINITGDLTSSTFPFEIRDTLPEPVTTVFKVGYNGSTYIGSDLQVVGTAKVNSTANSTSPTTGALVVDGGIGVANNAYIGSNASVAGNLSVSGNTTLTGNISVNGGDVFLPATAAIGYYGSAAAQTLNIATFAASGANSKTINIGTGNTTAETNVNIGYSGSGTTTINSPIVNITGNLTASNLTVSGTTTTINTTELLISDNTITLNSGYTGSTPSANAGIEVERGTLDNAAIRWNEFTDSWQFTNDGTNYSDIAATGDISNAEITIEGGTDLEINTSGGANGAFSLNQSTGETITIDHSAVSRTSYTGSTAAPAFGGTFTVIDDVGSSATGHVTSTNLKTVTVPTPADGILDWSTDKYAPYSDKQSSLVHFYTGSAAAPSNTDRLNLDAALWATKLYSGGNEVYTSANLPAYPTGFSISAGSTDGIFDITGTGGTNSVSYAVAPYSSKQPSGVHFYTGSAAAPDNTDRLNLDATLWATNVYSGGSEVLTSADLGSSIAQDLQAVTDNGQSTSQTITVGGITVGSGSANGTVQSNGNYDLIVKTGNATTGSITIADGSNGDITVSTNGSGATVFSNTTDASSSTAAAVEVSGGLAVAKKLYVGTGVTLPNTTTESAGTSSYTTLSASGSMDSVNYIITSATATLNPTRRAYDRVEVDYTAALTDGLALVSFTVYAIIRDNNRFIKTVSANAPQAISSTVTLTINEIADEVAIYLVSTHDGGGIADVTFISSSARVYYEPDTIIDNGGLTRLSPLGLVTPGLTTTEITIDGYDIKSDIDIDLVTFASGYVYVARSTSSTPTSEPTRYKVSTEGGALSTRLVKENIESIDPAIVSEFLDKVEIKRFSNMLSGREEISVVIEDEIEKSNPLSDVLFRRNNKAISFKAGSLPEFLKPYIGTEELLEEKDQNGNVSAYYFSPLSVNIKEYTSAAVLSAKHNHEEVKALKETNKKLKQILVSKGILTQAEADSL